MRECPRCRREKGYFVGDICGDCYAAGKDLDGPSATPREAPRLPLKKEVLPMPPMTTGVPKAAATPSVQRLKRCRHCSKEMPQGSLFRHEHVMCPKRPDSGEKARPAATRKKRAGRGRSPGLPRKVRAVSPPVVTPEGRTNGCPFCSGPDVALAKDLFTRMLRGGMAFDPAMELVRDISRAG